jgi:hypothetical protein
VTTPPVRRELDEVVATRPGERLVLDLETGGSVRVTGQADDDGRVHVRGQLVDRDGTVTRLEIARVWSGVRVRVKAASAPGAGSSTSHHFEISVPRRYDVTLRSAGGAVHLRDLSGRFRGRTGGGPLIIERASGQARLTTGGGSIRVVDADLSGSVITCAGRVLFARVRGGLRASSAFSPRFWTGGMR